MRRAAILATLFIVGAGVAVAQSDPQIERNDQMKAMGQQFYGALARMARGDAPFDQARVQAAWPLIEAAAKKAAPLYSAAPGQGAPNARYSPSPKIWEDKADFDARFVTLAKAIADNKGKTASLDEVKAAVGAVGQVCSGCHEKYQVRN